MRTKFFLRALYINLTYSLVLFLSAGTIHFLQGWVFLTVNIVMALMDIMTIKNNPELISERLHPGKGAKSWDKLILVIAALVYFLNVVIAGLDAGRFHWSPKFHWTVYALGVALMFTGQSIFLAARNENKFFSSVIRIQEERLHFVCDSGLYRFVRHPGYLGILILLAGVPLVTGSLWSLVTIFLSAVLLIIRTYLEDNTLKVELSGYLDYSHKTQHRLIPKVW